MKVTNEKNCLCHTCGVWFHYLGICSHRAGHARRGEVCEITYTHGDRKLHYPTAIELAAAGKKKKEA